METRMKQGYVLNSWQTCCDQSLTGTQPCASPREKCSVFTNSVLTVTSQNTITANNMYNREDKCELKEEGKLDLQGPLKLCQQEFVDKG